MAILTPTSGTDNQTGSNGQPDILNVNNAANLQSGDSFDARGSGGAGADTIQIASGLTANFTGVNLNDSWEVLQFIGTGNGGKAVLSATQIGVAAGLVSFVGRAGKPDVVQVNMTEVGTLDISGLTFTNVSRTYLYGTTGADTITGRNGADVIYDTASGTSAADTLAGGGGNDVYYVTNSNTTIVELFEGHTDSVFASVDFTLSENLEHLYLIGAGNINGTGNDGNNAIYGNSGNNVLTGGAGNDILRGYDGTNTLIGGIGNDTYHVQNSGDLIEEALNEGADRLYASVDFALTGGAHVETLYVSNAAGISLSGNELNNTINGGVGADTLIGGAGNDKLVGGGSNDRLIGGDGIDGLFGGPGVDTFVLDPSAVNRDNIYDLLSGTDLLEVSAATFGGGLTNGVALQPGQVVNNTTGLAGDADDRFVFKTTTKQLFYDADGDGGGVGIQIATLTGVDAITAGDFLIV